MNNTNYRRENKMHLDNKITCIDTHLTTLEFSQQVSWSLYVHCVKDKTTWISACQNVLSYFFITGSGLIFLCISEYNFEQDDPAKKAHAQHSALTNVVLPGVLIRSYIYNHFIEWVWYSGYHIAPRPQGVYSHAGRPRRPGTNPTLPH